MYSISIQVLITQYVLLALGLSVFVAIKRGHARAALIGLRRVAGHSALPALIFTVLVGALLTWGMTAFTSHVHKVTYEAVTAGMTHVAAHNIKSKGRK